MGITRSTNFPFSHIFFKKAFFPGSLKVGVVGLNVNFFSISAQDSFFIWKCLLVTLSGGSISVTSWSLFLPKYISEHWPEKSVTTNRVHDLHFDLSVVSIQNDSRVGFGS